MSTGGLKVLNKNSEATRRDQALVNNIGAARGLQEVVRTNLGPKGTIKMLVSGAGDIKITKDGSVLLHEMQIQHPTAHLIARAATSQDDMTGDGTTSSVILIGEIMKQSERYLQDGVHARVLSEGLELGKMKALEVLDRFRVQRETTRETLVEVARTSLATKLTPELAEHFAPIVVDAVLTIRRPGQPVDLFMVETMKMRHRLATESRLVRGLVLDHGARHHDMPKALDNAFILTCNVTMEYEKSEVNSSLFYSSAEQRVKLAEAERGVCDETVRKVIALKRQVCDTPDKHFVVINQKGIDPPSLQMLADEGIIAMRRAKRRNMERLTLACGGVALNSLEGMTAECLGHAGHVYEQVLGEDKFTFVEDCANPASCTILLKGPDDHTLNQLNDAIRDGLRAVKNMLDDGGFLVPGAGSYELAASAALRRYANSGDVVGRVRLGVEMFAQALLIVPRVLAENAGYDAIDTLMTLQEAQERADRAVAPGAQAAAVGVDLATGKPCDPAACGIWDNYCVTRQVVQTAAVVASQLLLVDVMMRAGKGGMGKGPRMAEAGQLE